MKRVSILTISLIFFSFIFIKCDKNDAKFDTKIYDVPEISELPHLTKGYELYSWGDNDNWYYTLIAGTNKLKSFEEIAGDNQSLNTNQLKITVNNVEELKLILTKLPENELVFWLGEEWIKSAWGNNLHHIQLAEDDTQNDLLKFCNQLKIRLSIIN